MQNSQEKSPSINQLVYFVSVAKHQSYRKAATALGISQPTLSNQINALEQLLNIRLFERSRNGTYISAHGKSLLEQAESVLIANSQLLKAAQICAGAENNTYRLGVPPTLGPYLLPKIFAELHKKYPALKFFVREAAPEQLYHDLLHGDFDLILSPVLRENSQLVCQPLFSEPLKFVVASDHPLAEHDFIQPEQLVNEKILTLEDKHHFHHQVVDICVKLGADLSHDYEGTSLDTLRQMVVMGMGSAFLPGLYIHSELHEPEALHVCEIAGIPITREHSLAWRNTSPSRQFFRSLAAEIRTLASDKLSTVVTVSS